MTETRSETRWTTIRRWALRLGLVLAVGALLVWAFAPRPTEVDVGTVTRGPLTVTLDEEGITRVRFRHTMTAPVARQMFRVDLEPGDPVVAGETVIATFTPAEPLLLDDRRRAELDAAREGAEARLERARAETDRAEAQLALAETERDRMARLAEEGIASFEQLDQAETRLAVLRDEARAARLAIRAARWDLESTRSLLDPPRGRRGEPVELVAPVDGVVLERFRESAGVVAAGEPLVELGDPATLEVMADYLSSDAVRIEPGQRAEIVHWGGGEALAARVRRIEPSGFTKISALGVEEQRVWVILDLVAPRHRWESLGDGFRVETRVVVWHDDDVLRVPVASLFRHGGVSGGVSGGEPGDERAAWAVFAVDGDRARLRPVELGRRDVHRARVLAGLEAGERVVLYPPSALEDGTAVSPRGGAADPRPDPDAAGEPETEGDEP